MNKKLAKILPISLVLFSVGLIGVYENTNHTISLFPKATGEHVHEGYHYAFNAPSNGIAGNLEYWTCCKCYDHVFTTKPSEWRNLGATEYHSFDSFSYVEPVNPAYLTVAKLISKDSGNETKFLTLDEAINAANTGDTVVISSLSNENFELPSTISKNIILKGDSEANRINFDCTGADDTSISAISSGITFENLSLEVGTNSRHGFYKAGTINMKNCEINGELFTYGDMNFSDCSFIQKNSGKYNIDCYYKNVTFTDCNFEGVGRNLHIYNPADNANYGKADYREVSNITLSNCTFKSTGLTVDKPAINVKETDGANNLNYNIVINNCHTEGKYPSANTGTGETYIISGLIQVDKKNLAHGYESGISIKIDENEVYPAFNSGHTMLNGQCVDCSAYAIDWSKALWKPEALEITDEKAPKGYEHIYRYNKECGGGISDCFFERNVILTDVVEFKFQMLTSRGDTYYIRPHSANVALRVPYQSYGANPDFVEITYTRANTSSNVWHITSTKPAGSTSGPAIDYTWTAANMIDANNLWAAVKLTNQNSPGFAPIVITDIIAKTSSYHMHKYGDLVPAVEATCEQTGGIAHYECEICNVLLNENRQPISSYATEKLAHNFNASGYCVDCGAYKMNYNEVRASTSVTYSLNNEAEKAPGFGEVYDVVSGGAPTAGDWAFLKSSTSFALYKKLTFATKVSANDEMGINITGATAGYYHIANHNGAWVTINLINNNGSWVVTVENAQLIKHGTSNVVASVVLGGATFHDLGLRKNDGNINTAMMTEIVAIWNTPGNHIHNLAGNDYCSACGKYVLSYEAGAYAGSSLLSHPDYISKAGFKGPENSGDFYYYNTSTGGALNSTTFFAHANLGIGYDRAINGQQWASFSFYILSTDINKARIVVPAIDGKQSASHLTIPRGCTKVEAKLENVDGTLYYGLYFNGSNTASGYVKRAGWGTLGENFQILSETGFYISEITYVKQAV